VAAFIGGSLVATEGAGSGLGPVFRAIVTREDEESVVEKLVAGAAGVRGSLEIVEKKPDLNVVLVNKVQTCTASWPAVHMTAGPYNLSASQGLAGSVRGVICGAGKVEEKRFF
tara:strand:- start:427 stop:765 length:339 start_codon:yes stop_codon:yes gene_type:complete